MCDYRDAYIAVKGRITLADTNNDNIRKKKPAVTNNTPFTSRIDNAEDLDIVMLMYNLLEYIDNYSMTSKVYGIIIEMKWMMIQTRILLQVIIG